MNQINDLRAESPETEVTYEAGEVAIMKVWAEYELGMEPNESLIPDRETEACRILTTAKPECSDRLTLVLTDSLLPAVLPFLSHVTNS